MDTEHHIGFHEATVVDVCRANREIKLSLEGVRVGGVAFAATVLLNGIRSITRDGVKVDDLVAEHDDGEVLSLEQTGTGIHLIIEWTDFKTHQSITRSYSVECDSVEVNVRR